MKEKKEDSKITLDSVMNNSNKKFGINTITTGNHIIYNPSRIPTSIFTLDLAIGGGIPLWGSTCLWGAKDGAKSTIVIKLIKMCKNICWNCFNSISFCTCSKKPLQLKAVVADPEGKLDIEWMEACGVKKDDYYLILGDTAEETFDIAESCLQADDCGLLAIDSLGGSTLEQIMENSVGDTDMGKHPQLITKVVKKLRTRLIREKKRLHPCTIVYTNQMRAKLDQLFGSKESMPGGYASIHDYTLVLRCAKRTLSPSDKTKFQDKERELNSVSRHVIGVIHSKISINRGSSEFLLAKENIESLNLIKGNTDDFKYVVAYGKEYGIIINSGGKWKFLDNKINFNCNNLDELQKYFNNNFQTYIKIQKDIIKEVKKGFKK